MYAATSSAKGQHRDFLRGALRVQVAPVSDYTRAMRSQTLALRLARAARDWHTRGGRYLPTRSICAAPVLKGGMMLPAVDVSARVRALHRCLHPPGLLSVSQRPTRAIGPVRY